ncbi:hypothetical protein [Sulfurimonas sp. HSL-1716]|uniref:hypothetical protein n=1 Tax=Hydrocurvibacter sulfurireducens TaxID=3131937 RepID=UPI0031F9EE5E
MSFKMVGDQRKVSNLLGTGIQYIPGHIEPYVDECVQEVQKYKPKRILEIGGGGFRFISEVITNEAIKEALIIEPDYYALDYKKILTKIDQLELIDLMEKKVNFFIGTDEKYFEINNIKMQFDCIAAFRVYHFSTPEKFQNIIQKFSEIMSENALLFLSGMCSLDYLTKEENIFFTNSMPINSEKYYRKLDQTNEMVRDAITKQNLPENILFLDMEFIERSIGKNFKVLKGPIMSTKIVAGYILQKV